ncbi:MAG: hypothetical protein ACREAA_04915 [Candidatus Polarisedimenticolia bacterium]
MLGGNGDDFGGQQRGRRERRKQRLSANCRQIVTAPAHEGLHDLLNGKANGKPQVLPADLRDRRMQVGACSVEPGEQIMDFAVIFTMSGADEDYQEVAGMLGAKRGFRKPVALGELIAAVRGATRAPV